MIRIQQVSWNEKDDGNDDDDDDDDDDNDDDDDDSIEKGSEFELY